MKRFENNYTAPAVEINEVVVEQGIAFSDPSNIDLELPGLGEEGNWDTIQ
ncbi:MAG: hypothetical protein IKL67_03940 [Tidjanibacter sp.]|nr:hypothetical protein [Tidjanibacter sp.]